MTDAIHEFTVNGIVQKGRLTVKVLMGTEN